MFVGSGHSRFKTQHATELVWKSWHTGNTNSTQYTVHTGYDTQYSVNSKVYGLKKAHVALLAETRHPLAKVL